MQETLSSDGVDSPPEPEPQLAERLRQHVVTLAGEIGERNVWRYDELGAAAEYIEQELRGLDCELSRQDYEAESRTVSNVEAERPGASRPEEIVVVGAHYDTVPMCPGANDNASGVAAVIETARLLAGRRLSRTVRFVGFVNEEPPFFQTPGMGSRVYAARSRQRGERIAAMLSLETVGCYSNQPGSQRYPFPFGLAYPNTGNFIGFVGNVGSTRLLRRALKSFRKHSEFPAEGVAAPGWMMGIGWSDQWSFWKEGYQALMVTDTALFRYDQYHTLEDTPDRLCYEPMARVVAGCANVVADLAGAADDAR